MRISSRLARSIVRLGILAIVGWCGRDASAATVTIEPPDTTVMLNDTLVIRAQIDAYPEIKAYQLVYNFLPSIIQILGTDPGDVLTDTPEFLAIDRAEYDAPDDSVWYNASVLDGKSDGPGILVFMRFRATMVGITPIGAKLADFRDSDNNRTDVPSIGGIVRVIGPTPVVPSTWARLKRLYR